MARTITIEFLGNARGVQQAANQANDSAQQMGGRFNSLGTGASAAFAAIAAAAVAAGKIIYDALNQGIEIEASLDRVEAALGLTAQRAERYGEIASGLYRDAWGESTTDVIDSVEAVASSFRDLARDKDLERVTRQAITFSDVFRVDLPTAVSQAQTVVSSGLAKNATRAFDLMTRAAQKVPAALRENVNDAAEEYAQFFNQLGFDGSEAFGILTKAAEDGQYGIDKAGDAIKEFTIRSTDMSSTSVAAYQAIGLSAEEMSNKILRGGDSSRRAFDKIIKGLLGIEDPSKRANTAIALFGTPIEDLNVGEIPDFLRGLRQGARGLDRVKGSADRAGEALGSNTKSKLEAFKRQLKGNVTDYINDEVLPALEDLADKFERDVAPKVRDAAIRVKEFGDNVSDYIANDKDSQRVIQNTSDSLEGFGDTLRDDVSPEISRARDNLENNLKPAWDSLKSNLDKKVIPALGRLSEAFDKKVRPALERIIRFNAKVTGAFVDMASRIAGFVLSKFIGAVSSMISWGSDLVVALVTVPGDIISAFRRMSEKVSNFASSVVTTATGLPGKITRGIGDLANTLFSKGADLVQGFIDGIQSKIAALRAKAAELKNMASGGDGGWFDGLPDAGDLLNQLGRAIDPAASGLLGRVAAALKQQVAPMFAAVGQQISRALDLGIKDGLTGDARKRALKQLTDSLKDASRAIAQSAQDIASRYAQALRNVLNARNQFAEGFSSFESSVFGADYTDPITGADTSDIVSILDKAREQVAAAEKLREDIKKLVGLGLSKDLLRQLQESGASGVAQISALAGSASAAQIAELNALNAQAQQATAAAGMSAANAVYGSQIRNAQQQATAANQIARDIKIEINGAIDKRATAQEIVKILRQLKRELGTDLGLA